MNATRALATAAVLLFTAAASASAQSLDRFWISAGGGVQQTSNGFGDGIDVTSQFQDPEGGRASIDYPVKTGALVDGAFRVRLWRGLAAGVGVTHYSARSSATIAAQVPHPFRFNDLRSIEGSTSTKRTEIGVHLQMAYIVPIGERLRVTGFGGPSRLSAEQTFVTDVQYSQSFPFDTATFSGATTRRSTASAIGFNAGADVAWMFSRRIGLGGLVQYTAARPKENAGDEREITVDAGGIQAGAGIRLVF